MLHPAPFGVLHCMLARVSRMTHCMTFCAQVEVQDAQQDDELHASSSEQDDAVHGILCTG